MLDWFLSLTAEGGDMQFNPVVFFIDRYGFPAGLLLVIGWGGLKACRWIAPRLDSMFERHERLLKTLEEELREQRRIMESMEENQRRVLECLDEFSHVAREARRSLEDK